MRGPSDGKLIDGTLVLVDRTSKLRLGLLLHENTERNFCLSHFHGDLSLLGGVDMARRSVIDGTSMQDVNICLYNLTVESRRVTIHINYYTLATCK